MKIFIPSYKRAGKVKTRITLGCGIVVCHEFEAEEYGQAEGQPLLIIPDELRGNISKVRNFILDNADDEEVVMMDDDISEIGYHESLEQIEMSADQILAFLRHGYFVAREMGVKLWGINLQSDPKFYREYSPFSFLSPILGTFSCHLNQELRYDESLFLNEDYDLFLKIIQRYRRVLRFNKFYYMADHLDKSGGCGAYRMKDFEIEQAKVMQRRWGKKIVKYDFKRSTNPRIYVPIPGI